MVALATLTDHERADMVADRELTLRIRGEYRGRLGALVMAGKSNHPQADKLREQIETCSRWVRHYDCELAKQ